ncbi:MAG: hypothetical protein AB7P07_01010 [Hyphomonadaceae bacterium]
MIRAFTALFVLACAACSADERPAAMIAGPIALSENGEGASCTTDGAVCVTPPGEDGGARLERTGEDALTIAFDGPRAVWEQAYREVGGAVIVGFIETTEQMYSGGSGRAEYVNLYRVTGAQAASVARLPLSAAIGLRACFDEADVAARREACQDEYQFTSAITFEPAADGPPNLRVNTDATTFPGQRSRSEDSSEQPALADEDLVHWRDPDCSYQRVYTFQDGQYATEPPPPACSDYLEP